MRSRPHKRSLTAAATAAALFMVGTGLVLAPAPAAANDSRTNVIGGQALASADTIVGSGPGVRPVPDIPAATWLLADASSGAVLAARGAHIKRPPASTIKMLTALTVLPQLNLEEEYTVVADDIAVVGSKVGLLVGEPYTHEQLLTALFLPSANDAAGALARANGGWGLTIGQMNAEAVRLRALDTTAANPSGLDAKGQVSSAYDLALIARAGLANEDFARLAATTKAAFPGTTSSSGKRNTFEIQNQNRLLGGRYDGALGVKNGFTTKAGRTFVGAAERDGRTLIVSLMGIEQPSHIAAAALLDWGFANAARIDEAPGVLVEPATTASPRTAEESSGRDVALDPLDTAGGPTTFTEGLPRTLLAGAAILAGVTLVTVAALGNGAMTRRRIRRRYR